MQTPPRVDHDGYPLTPEKPQTPPELHIEPGLEAAGLLVQMRRFAENEDVFRIMLVGEAGLGKSTLVNCLLQAEQRHAKLEVSEGMESESWTEVTELPGGTSTEEMRRYRYVFTTSDMGHTRSAVYEIIDTPGFASQINNANSWMSKLKLLETGMMSFVDSRTSASSLFCLKDTRVHLCLYVIAPQPRPLKELDKRVMLELQRCVPVLPIISKADTFDSETLEAFQDKLRQEFRSIGFVDITSMEGCPAITKDGKQAQAPFAIIASNKAYRRHAEDSSQWVRCDIGEAGACHGRLYRWGLASCEESSELGELRQVLVNPNIRHFLLKQCDKHTQTWHDLRTLKIAEIANGFAEADALADFQRAQQRAQFVYDSAVQKWNSGCPFCRGDPPTYEIPIKPVAVVTAQYREDALKVWMEGFGTAFTSFSSLQQEAELHVDVSQGGDVATPTASQTLQRIYSRRASMDFQDVTEATARLRGTTTAQQVGTMLSKSLSSGKLGKFVETMVGSALQGAGLSPVVSGVMAEIMVGGVRACVRRSADAD